MCRIKGLNTTGNKVQMRYQLALAAARSCPSYVVGAVTAAGDADDGMDVGE